MYEKLHLTFNEDVITYPCLNPGGFGRAPYGHPFHF